MRLREVLLRRAGGGFGPWRIETLHAAILNHSEMKPRTDSMGGNILTTVAEYFELDILES